jgi:hypothetical protein
VALFGCTPEPAATPAPLHAPRDLAPEGPRDDGAARAQRADALAASESSRAGARVIEVGQSRIEVTLPRGAFAGHDAELLGWIERCARAVAGYYGVFPVARVIIRIRASSEAGIRDGQTLSTSPPTISIAVGERTSSVDFERNWSMTHEMVHLAFPNVPSAHHWIEEGLATYVEPIARARAGWITEESVWAEWIENMPLGLPANPGDGLDGTDSWGRTYWGGALFCLVADVELLRRSHGQQGLEHALRAIVAAGGSVAERWPLERALRTGDEATGTGVLLETYRAMKDKAGNTDLAALWKELGVELDAGRIRFIDSAPLAAVRRALVSGRR